MNDHFHNISHKRRFKKNRDLFESNFGIKLGKISRAEVEIESGSKTLTFILRCFYIHLGYNDRIYLSENVDLIIAIPPKLIA